ncbi:MAG: T9SS type A sorting domain-containing protein [Limnohabitans sp.]|nr:T9SS type A sorting domain-containing protein [Limnohabitans sp.]
MLTNYKIYPNITTGVVNVDFEYTSNAALEVYDINGKLLINKKMIDTRNQVDISNLPSAMYLFKLVSERGEVVEKIVKQ